MSANHTLRTLKGARKIKAWRELFAASKKHDLHFFTPETMDYWNSLLVGNPYQLPYDHRVFFVTGEADSENMNRRYTVRVMDVTTGRITSVSEHGQYGSPMEAVAARNAIVGYE